MFWNAVIAYFTHANKLFFLLADLCAHQLWLDVLFKSSAGSLLSVASICYLHPHLNSGSAHSAHRDPLSSAESRGPADL